MKIVKAVPVLLIMFGFLFGTTSCFVTYKTDNGKHKGWYKNTHNPHHPASNNPGHGKGNGKGNKRR